MPPIKSLDRIKSKWKRVTEGADAEYLEGVQNPAKDWADETQKANAAYKSGIQASLAADSFVKGVRRAGTSTWQDGAVNKGPLRFSQGVALAEQKYADGFQPYREVIQATNLPARGRRGDPKNMQRSVIMAKALHDKRVQIQGGA